MLSWIKLLIVRYRECPELAWGKYTILDTDDPAVLAHRCDIDDGTVIAVHNLADREVRVRLELSGMDSPDVLADLLADEKTAVSGSGEVRLSLGPYGCRWLRAHR